MEPDLPILNFEGDFLAAINQNNVICVCGPPGTGKSTKTPQFILGSKSEKVTLIGLTLNRRVAASLLFQRLRKEMDGSISIGLQTSSFQTWSPRDKLKVMTDGILLKELQSDPMLLKYSHIIVDEVQCRRLNTDMLLCILPRVSKYRTKIGNPLKIVFLAGNADVHVLLHSLHSSSFPLLELSGKQYDVTNHFLSYCPVDYIQECLQMVQRIHTRLPPGTILVFLTGKRDISSLFRLLHDWAFSIGDSSLQLVQLHSKSDRSELFESSPLDQSQRLCIICTNVAETSITLPEVKYVVDCGKVKKRSYNRQNGVFRYCVEWESKTSAIQRRGRAGRTQNGHCYYLFDSSTYFTLLPDEDRPEICDCPLEDMLLTLLTIGLEPTSQLINKLYHVDKNAINHSKQNMERMRLLNNSGELTTTGMVVGTLPFSLKSSYLVAQFASKHPTLLTQAIMFAFLYDSFPEEAFNFTSGSCNCKSDIIGALRKFPSLAASYSLEFDVALSKTRRALHVQDLKCGTESHSAMTKDQELLFNDIVIRSLPWNVAQLDESGLYRFTSGQEPVECEISSGSCVNGKPKFVFFLDIFQFGSSRPKLIGVSEIKLH
jgi:HrpA-like RNA helicase